MNTYQVKGIIGGTDEIKTVIVQDVVSGNDAADYAAMFHNIDEIKSIKQGTLLKGQFVPSEPEYMRANELQPGMTVRLLDQSVCRISRVDQSVYVNHTRLEFEGGSYTDVKNSTEVEII